MRRNVSRHEDLRSRTDRFIPRCNGVYNEWIDSYRPSESLYVVEGLSNGCIFENRWQPSTSWLGAQSHSSLEHHLHQCDRSCVGVVHFPYDLGMLEHSISDSAMPAHCTAWRVMPTHRRKRCLESEPNSMRQQAVTLDMHTSGPIKDARQAPMCLCV